MDSAGNVYVADEFSHDDTEDRHLVKRDDAGGQRPACRAWANGPGSVAQFSGPVGVAVDSATNVYVAEYNNDDIRKIDSAGNVTTLAGGRGRHARTASPARRSCAPSGLALDSARNIDVGGLVNNRISKGILLSQNVIAVTSPSGIELQWTTNLAGSWVDIPVPGSSSPFIMVPSGPQKFSAAGNRLGTRETGYARSLPLSPFQDALMNRTAPGCWL